MKGRPIWSETGGRFDAVKGATIQAIAVGES